MRITVFLTIALLMAGFVNAQDSLRAGFKVGFNQSSVIQQDFVEGGSAENLGGAEIGIITLFKINETLSLSPGLAFSQKGFRVAYEENNSYKTRLQYLEVPVTARLNFQIGKVTLFSNIGPYFGWLLSGKESGTKPNPSSLPDEPDFVEAEANVTRDYTFGDLGVTGGLGLMYPFWKGHLMLQLNYQEGLVNIYHDDSPMVQNKGYQVALGYLVPFD